MIDPQSKLQFFAVYPTSSIAAHASEQTDPTEQTVKVTGIADLRRRHTFLSANKFHVIITGHKLR
jgi:hypothetical protein